MTIISITPLSKAWGMSGSEEKNDSVSFGIIADLHYANKETWRSRYYRDSDEKLTKCIEMFNAAKPPFIIELGDFIDADEKEIEIGYLKRIDGIFRKFSGERHYVLGNHDMATFSKEEFMSLNGSRGKYYSFDHGSYHFVVLDANYNGDGSDYNAGNFDWTETYIHLPQQEWLRSDLEQARGKSTVVFVHQNLHDETDVHGVKNALEIRQILENANSVRAVFQGHDHRGGYREINGIHYVTFQGAVEGPGLENNRYALVNMDKKKITITGYGKQESMGF